MSTVDIEDHGMACVMYGDCIYDVVQEGAKDLQTKWTATCRKWDSLVDKAVKTGFLGWGSPLVGRDWLTHMLLQPPRVWPRGLTKKEVAILKLSAEAAQLAKKAQNVPNPLPRTLSPEDSAKTLAAMKKFAALFDKQIGQPMLDDYWDVSTAYGKQIEPLCAEKYNEPCSPSEAVDIFRGDIERGLRAKTLDVRTPMYWAFPRFLEYTQA